jgi:hypothetical protein
MRFSKTRLVFAALVAIALGVASASALAPTTGDETLDGPEAVQPDGSGSALGAQAADPSGGPRWVVRVYASKTGATCPEAARSDGTTVGRVDASGKFSPLDQQASGSCTDLTKTALSIAVNRYPAHSAGGARAVIFGVVSPRVRSLNLSDDRGSEPITVKNHSFLAVRSDASLASVTLDVTTDDGKNMSYPLDSAAEPPNTGTP